MPLGRILETFKIGAHRTPEISIRALQAKGKKAACRIFVSGAMQQCGIQDSQMIGVELGGATAGMADVEIAGQVIKAGAGLNCIRGANVGKITVQSHSFDPIFAQ